MMCEPWKGMIAGLAWIGVVLASSAVAAETLQLDGEVRRLTSLSGMAVRMAGRSELHCSGDVESLADCSVEMVSPDAWLFLPRIKPSEVVETVLEQVEVDGQKAELGDNVRVVQYGQGAVIIPHGEAFEPLEVFSAKCFTGHAHRLGQYTEYDSAKLGPAAGTISSFILKRGYMATLAANEDGTGASRCYVAQDADLEVAALPDELDNSIKFVRIFPWRWVSKKGSCDIGPETLDAKWHYNWNLNKESTLDWEYVAIKQHANWPGLDRDWKVLGVNHLLGYNEPNNHVEDGYKNLNPPGSVDNAVERWPDLLRTGLRVGSPAVTDGGRGWILDFMKKAEEKNYRVDFVAIHYYRSYWNKDDPEGAARQLYGFLKDIHDQTGKPIWLTEWNNGANWTDNNHDPAPEQQERAIAAMINMLDATPWVERYAIYSNVEDFRKVHLNGSLTPAGRVYHDQETPIGFVQPPPPSGASSEALFLFADNFMDSSGNGNNPVAYGSPAFVDIGQRTALAFDGENDYLQLPPRRGAAGGDDEVELGFAAWINWAGGGRQYLFSFGDRPDRFFGLSLSDEDAAGMELILRRGEETLRMDTPRLTPGLWTHVAVSISNRSVKLYVDGRMVKASSSMAFAPTDLETSLNYIGRGPDADEAFFNGQILQLQLAGHDFSDAEVEKLAERVAVQFEDRELRFHVTAGMRFSGSLKGLARGGKGRLRYAKAAGSDWLSVKPDGRMVGRPAESDEGINRFIVSVEDEGGRVDAREMIIEVRKR